MIKCVVFLQQLEMFNIHKYKEIIKETRDLGKKTQIIAVSKNHPKELVGDALKNGVRIFGENKVQEAKTKFEDLKAKHPDLELHLTGPLQTNKTKEAIKLLEYLASPKGSEGLAGPTYEHPLKGSNNAKEVKVFGAFRPDGVTINQLGSNNAKAIRLMKQSGWK